MKKLGDLRLSGFAILACSILLAGCGDSGSKDSAEQNATSPNSGQIAAVKVLEVQTGSLKLTVQGMGLLRSRQQLPISADIGGTVVQKCVDIGDPVRAGGEMVLLDPEPYELALQQARAAYSSAQVAFDQAQRDFKRNQKLRESEDVSEFDLENSQLGARTAQANCQMAEAALKLAERNLRLTRLTSPIAGHVADLEVQIGQQVTPGMPLGSIVALDQMEVEIGLSETEIAGMKPGQEARVLVDAHPSRSFSGKVRSVGVAGLEPGNTFPVLVSVDNSSGLLRPGMAAGIEITCANHQNILSIPRSALITANGQEPCLFVIAEGRAHRRQVILGSGNDQQVIVKSGLLPGEMLVIEGQSVLQDSTQVKIL